MSHQELVYSNSDADADADGSTEVAWALAPIDFACAPYILDVALVFRSDLSAERMKTTLSVLLSSYPVLSGRLDDSGSVVSYCNEGVPFTVIDSRGSSGSVNSLRADAPRGIWTPIQELTEMGAMLSVKLTYLDDGCVLGVCVAHRCMDGNSFYTFLKNWAALCRGAPLSINPLLDQTLAPNCTLNRVKAEVEAGWVAASPASGYLWEEAARTGRVTRRFGPIRFSTAVLARIKQLAMKPLESCVSSTDTANSCSSNTMTSAATFITTNEAISAHLAQASACALGWEHGYPLCVAALVDLRERIVSIPSNFSGNALGFATATVPVGCSLGCSAAALHKAWQPFAARPSSLLERRTLMFVENRLHETGFSPVDFDNLIVTKPNTIYTNNFAKFPVYEDFGCGMPSFVIPQHTTDSVLLFPAPPLPVEGGHPDGGLDIYFQGGMAEVWLALSEDHEAWKMLLEFHDDPQEKLASLLQQRENRVMS